MKVVSQDKEKGTWKNTFWSKYGVPIAFIAVCIVLSVSTRSFLSMDNWLNILRQISIMAIAAIGSTMILISGGIDISVSAVMALSGVTTIGLMVNGEVNVIIAIIAGVAAGAVIGFINGIIITKIRIPPFIATLGTMKIIRGLCFVYTHGSSVSGNNIPEAFTAIGRGYLGPIPIPVIIMVLLYLVFTFIMKKTVLGVHIYAIGSNEKASTLSGISVNKVRIILYVIASTLASVSGIILAARLNSAQAGAADGWEFDILTSAIIGGTSIYGGKGYIPRTLLGAGMIGVLNNGMTLMNISQFYQMIASGVILVLALALDRINSRD